MDIRGFKNSILMYEVTRYLFILLLKYTLNYNLYIGYLHTKIFI